MPFEFSYSLSRVMDVGRKPYVYRYKREELWRDANSSINEGGEPISHNEDEVIEDGSDNFDNFSPTFSIFNRSLFS